MVMVAKTALILVAKERVAKKPNSRFMTLKTSCQYTQMLDWGIGAFGKESRYGRYLTLWTVKGVTWCIRRVALVPVV